jgi:PadR family transcriptional regulator, regulatory protein PadR
METDGAELRKFRKELNAGAVSLVVLALLERSLAPMYGYQIGRCMEEMAGGAPLVKQGTLYPLLRTMESNGLLHSEVEPSVTGPPRRYYRITHQGRQILPLWRHAWEQTRGFVDAALGGAHRQETTAAAAASEGSEDASGK